MSSQKGNVRRTRGQKHQNGSAFKNDLHDKTPRAQVIKNLDVSDVCEKCHDKLMWKVKYKKYKPLTVPGKCTKCEQKTIRHAYHLMCSQCARALGVCAKCGLGKEVLKRAVTQEEQAKMDSQMDRELKTLSERKRRTFFRYLAKMGKDKASVSGEDGSVEKSAVDVQAFLEKLKLDTKRDSDEDWEDEDDESDYSDFD